MIRAPTKACERTVLCGHNRREQEKPGRQQGPDRPADSIFGERLPDSHHKQVITVGHGEQRLHKGLKRQAGAFHVLRGWMPD